MDVALGHAIEIAQVTAALFRPLSSSFQDRKPKERLEVIAIDGWVLQAVSAIRHSLRHVIMQLVGGDRTVMIYVGARLSQRAHEFERECAVSKPIIRVREFEAVRG